MAKLKDSTMARIEWLGQLNDRRLKANHANDLDALERIAAEYAARPYMQNTANEIRIAVKVRREVMKANHTGDPT